MRFGVAFRVYIIVWAARPDLRIITIASIRTTLSFSFLFILAFHSNFGNFERWFGCRSISLGGLRLRNVWLLILWFEIKVIIIGC